MPLLSGRLLSSRYGEDATGGNVLVNALAARQFGYSIQEAPGKVISLGGEQLADCLAHAGAYPGAIKYYSMVRSSDPNGKNATHSLVSLSSDKRQPAKGN